MALTEHSGCVADKNVIIRIPDRLKSEFQRALDGEAGEEFGHKMTPFLLEAIRAFVVQAKRRERIATPIEFVSDKSSDKLK